MSTETKPASWKFSPLSGEELAYIAGVIDTQAIIRTRKSHEGTELPMVAMHSPNMELLQWLADFTGTKVTVVRRAYPKAGCNEHCPEKHVHIVSVAGRWSVSGVKATVLLAAIQRHLRWQAEAAGEVLAIGLAAPRKSATAGKAYELGWPVPEEWRDDRDPEEADAGKVAP